MKTIYIILLLGLSLTACDFAEFTNNENLSLRVTGFTLIATDGLTEINYSNSSNFLVSGGCLQEGASVSFNYTSTVVTCQDATYSAVLDLSALPDGTISLIAEIQDPDLGPIQSAPLILIKSVVLPVTNLVYGGLNQGESVELPLAIGFNYDFTVDWGDGSPISIITSGTDPDRIHTYSSAGNYTVTLTGTAEAMSSTCLGNFSGSSRLTEAHLGDMGWVNFDNAFSDCIDLNVVNISNTSSVNSMQSMFANTVVSVLNANEWDTSNVTDMSSMFENTANTNPDVSGWDTSNVMDMSNMFNNAVDANPEFMNWDFSGLDVNFLVPLQGILQSSAVTNGRYSRFLIQLEATAPSGVPYDLGIIPAQYQSSAATARSNLISAGYTISDNGPE